MCSFGIAPALLPRQSPDRYIASGKLGRVRLVERSDITIFYGTEGTMIIGKSTWQVHHKHGTVRRFLLL